MIKLRFALPIFSFLALIALYFTPIIFAVGPEENSGRDDPRECGIQSVQFRWNVQFEGDAIVAIEFFHNPYDTTWSSNLGPNPTRKTLPGIGVSPNPGGCVRRFSIGNFQPNLDGDLYYDPLDFVLVIEGKLLPTAEWIELGRLSNWVQTGHFVNSIYLLPLTPTDTLQSMLLPSITNNASIRFRYEVPSTGARAWNQSLRAMSIPPVYTPEVPITSLVIGRQAKDTPAKNMTFVPVAQVDHGATGPVTLDPGIRSTEKKKKKKPSPL